MHRHATLIDRWPTTNAFARALNENIQTVHAWRRRGIPPRAWGKVVDLFQKEGWIDVSFETLSIGYAGSGPRVTSAKSKRQAGISEGARG